MGLILLIYLTRHKVSDMIIQYVDTGFEETVSGLRKQFSEQEEILRFPEDLQPPCSQGMLVLR